MYDIVRPGKIQAQASGLQTDQEHMFLPLLEGGYHLRPFGSRDFPVQIEILHALLLELPCDSGKISGKLAEHQDAVVPRKDFPCQIQKSFGLG